MPHKRMSRRYRVVVEGRPAAAEGRPGLCERHFYLLAFGVILVSVLTRTFDFSLSPLSYHGLFITRPYYGLHDWHFAHQAWDARSHVKYGLGYTKGYRTPAVGDPPAANPQRYVSNPPLDTLIKAFGMMLLGTAEWQIRLFDLILSVPILLMILLLLRKLYNAPTALVSGLLLVVLPIFAYFYFEPLILLMSLWALYRYLALTGRLQDAPQPRKRHYLELAVALLLMIQLGWSGVFPAFVIGAHYVICSLIRRRIQWKVLTVVAVASLSSLALNGYVMLTGMMANMQAEAAARGVVERKEGQLEAAWGLVKTLAYIWGHHTYFQDAIPAIDCLLLTIPRGGRIIGTVTHFILDMCGSYG